MSRHPNASLSEHELTSLRRVSFDPKQVLPSAHLQLLLSMNLIAVVAGQVTITAEGQKRLERAEPDRRQGQYSSGGLSKA